MIDLKLLEKDFDFVSEKLLTRGVSRDILAIVLDASNEAKSSKRRVEDLTAIQNEKSKLFPIYKKEGKDTTSLKEELDKLKAEIAEYQILSDEKALELEILALSLPNLPADDTPIGKDEDENVVIKTVGMVPLFNFAVKDHVDLGEGLGWLDFERAAKLAKSRFVVVANYGAKIERALINYMLDFNSKRGFVEVSPPYIVNEDMLRGTGQLPKFAEDQFEVYGADSRRMYLIPTAEVPLTNLYNDEIIPIDNLPIRMTAHSPCFRKEAGSAGRDTRGMIRQHQFHKVELVSITSPEQSDAVFEEMISCASDLLASLGLAHRLVRLCTGDMGFSAAKTVDLEVWIPSQNKYREISSISNCFDFQARRAKIRYKDGKTNKIAHTLNGSSLAVGRTLVAIMENYQTSDGGVEIPAALKSYL
ncbi:MAG: seryl-tRNA synthetase [Pseudomonadota bacterium]|jgi:seryl-tRNA synthetase